MQNLTGKNTGDPLTAAEWNQLPAEVQNVITSSGQSLSGGDLIQLVKGLTIYATQYKFHTDAGAADAYVLSPSGSFQPLISYQNGAQLSFIADNENTGASTVNISGIGIASIVDVDNNALLGGEINTTEITTIQYDSVASNFKRILGVSHRGFADYTPGATTYLHDDNTDATDFDAAAALTDGGGFESIGPTASGATNTWAALDALPDNATHAILLVQISGIRSGVVDAAFTFQVYSRKNGSAAATSDQTTIAEGGDFGGTTITGQTRQRLQVAIPLSAANIFDMAYSTTNLTSAETLSLKLKGFRTI